MIYFQYYVSPSFIKLPSYSYFSTPEYQLRLAAFQSLGFKVVYHVVR